MDDNVERAYLLIYIRLVQQLPPCAGLRIHVCAADRISACRVEAESPEIGCRQTLIACATHGHSRRTRNRSWDQGKTHSFGRWCCSKVEFGRGTVVYQIDQLRLGRVKGGDPPFSLTTGLFSISFVRDAKLRRQFIEFTNTTRAGGHRLECVQRILPELVARREIANKQANRRAAQCILQNSCQL